MGKEALLHLWAYGPTKEPSALKIVDEIDRNVLELLLQHIKVTEKSKETTLTLDSNTSPEHTEPYMDPVIFPEFVVKAGETLPSETYTYIIRAPKGADAYLSLLNHVWKYGVDVSIDADSENVKEIRDTVVVIEKEQPQDFFLPAWLSENTALSINQHSLHEYYKTQFSDELYRKELFPGVSRFERPQDYSYLYAELMYAFPRQAIINQTVDFIFKKYGYEETKKYLVENSVLTLKESNALVEKVEQKIQENQTRITILLEAFLPAFDQVANVIERIKRKPQDLDKEIVLWDQRYHTHIESGRPCLFKISFSVRNDQIDVHAFVRTHDIGKAWFFNYYGISQLLGKIALETDKKPGIIVIESQSAHIYKRDWEIIREIVEKEVTNKDARMFFDPDVDGDPRGIVNVSVVDGKINIKLQDTSTGAQLFETEGRTARELLYKMKHHQLISRIDHGIFIGGELAKAEICLKLGIPYKYDNPIILPNGEKVMS